MEERHFVLLEQVQDAVVVLLHHFVFAADHLRHIDAQVVQADAVLGKGVAGVFEVLAGLQQRLARDAADVGAGAAGRGAALVVLPLINAGDIHAQLRRADRADVAAGAGADHDHVK